ncbi:unnamed protein product [Ilex paraguariensis]|uniref:Uncharacterized protein n=1 Tax=Ilex paraguariensis TaxID=185542 RepID=A0ABC8RSQ4_9AQUA
MDIWVVAAAAGAVYVGQHWKNILRDGGSFSVSSSGRSFVKPESSLFKAQIQDKNCPFSSLVQRKKPVEDPYMEEEPISDGDSMAEVTSTSGSDGTKLLELGNHKDCNLLSISSLSPEVLSTEDLQGDRRVISGEIGENFGDLLLKPSIRDIGFAFGSARNKSTLKSGRTQFIKPLSSLQSCLVAQMYKEHAEMEEYILSSIPSPSSPTVKPFFVTDGGRIICRASGDVFSRATGIRKNKMHKESYSKENDTVLGIPPLPNARSLKIVRKMKVKMGKERSGRLSSSRKMVNGNHVSQDASGSSHGALLFCLGISVGIISSLLANNREVNKLNELLKQTENLVQDLQEELEMKDSLTVKQLATEDYESLDTHHNYNNKGAPPALSPLQNFHEPTKYDHEELHDQKADEESLSKIEAELEAELERLELNMNSSSLEGKLFDLVEIDPDSVPDIVQGELRTDMLGWQAGAQPYADRDGSGSSTTHSANYAVSPRELSLRLHEILQSRLEERVKELETELQNSQKKVQYMVSERINSWREFSNSEAGSSSIQGSPIAKEEQNPAEQTLIINLSDEPRYACNGAYDEFTKIESEEEDSPSGIRKNSYQESLQSFDGNLYIVQNGVVNHDMPFQPLTKENGATTFIQQKGEDYITFSNDIGSSGDENDNDHDETEKLLIKQIVEKARKGSPVVLNAQRALFFRDENLL